jgi:hypothetical protein
MGIYNANPEIQGSLTQYWGNGHSTVLVGGIIEQFLVTELEKIEKNISFVIVTADGVLSNDGFEESTKWCISPISHIENVFLSHLKSETIHVICMLCTRFIDPVPYILLPLDDKTFSEGLLPTLSDITRPAWEDKKAIAVWRGSVTAGYPSIRTKTTELLWNYEKTDLKLIRYAGWDENKPIPEEHFGERYSLEKQFEYKYIFIIDGACIASNHQWVFGSGSVPLMITHPDNNYWFKQHLKPMVNYVPINYDLSDVKEKIDWLINNDEQAKSIMLEAMKLAHTVFSHEGQVEYLRNEIGRITQKNAPIEDIETGNETSSLERQS